MAARPLVGVTGHARRWAPGWWCARLALVLVGARAVRIAVGRDEPARFPDALVIGGGDDIGPEHYGGDLEAPVKTDPDRDRLEIDWIKRALVRGTPLLGICRGAQLINAVHGGSLHQDIRDLRRRTRNRPGLLATKRVHLEPGSKVARLMGKTRIRVNSLHHQAIRDPGDGLEVTGRDLDDIVQCVEGAGEARILAVQWHPEYLFYLPGQLSLFRWLVHRANQ